MTPSSKPDTRDSPAEGQGQSPKRWQTRKKYTSSQAATAVGKAVAAVVEDNLPLDARGEALELTRRWLMELQE